MSRTIVIHKTISNIIYQHTYNGNPRRGKGAVKFFEEIMAGNVLNLMKKH